MDLVYNNNCNFNKWYIHNRVYIHDLYSLMLDFIEKYDFKIKYLEKDVFKSFVVFCYHNSNIYVPNS